MNDPPVACALDPATRQTRREGLLQDLLRLAERHEEDTAGHHLHFAASEDTLTLIARAINAERLCCRFLRFTLTVEPDEGQMYLDLTGPPGTREFLSALFDQ